MIDWDKRILIGLNNLGSPGWDPFWILISDRWVWLPLYAILFYLILRNYEKKKVVYLLLFLVIGLTISDQLAGIFKVMIGRLRPLYEPSLDGLLRKPVSAGRFGFYSSHASNSFFLASYLTKVFRKKNRWIPFLFLWAGIVSFSRVYLAVHYPLDIGIGAGMGFLLGGLFGTLFEINFSRKKLSFLQDKK